MQQTPGRLTDNIEEVVRQYGDMLFRICLVILGNKYDAEDAVQETILKYIKKVFAFNNSEHEKAWLITVATNTCRDMKRFSLRYTEFDIECLQDLSSNANSSGILEALMKLPDKFRIVLMLHYVEECKVEDIAKMIKRTPSAVKMRLQKGRKLLEEVYRKEYI